MQNGSRAGLERTISHERIDDDHGDYDDRPCGRASGSRGLGRRDARDLQQASPRAAPKLVAWRERHRKVARDGSGHVSDARVYPRTVAEDPPAALPPNGDGTKEGA